MKYGCKIVSYILCSIALVARAQQTVMTQNGTINNVPKFSDAVTLSPSAINEVNGNVGIGTNNPQSLLYIQGNQGQNFVQLFNSYTQPQSSSQTGIIFSGAAAPNGFSMIQGGGDFCCLNNGSGYLAFQTAYAAGGLEERMRITAYGNVGIALQYPQNALSTSGGINVDQYDEDDGTNNFTSYSSTLGISFGDASGEGIGSARVQGAANLYGLDFFTAFTKRLSITYAGNVGIGTTSPGADLASLTSPPSTSTPILEVNGDIALTQNTTAQHTGGSVIFSDGTVQNTAWNGTTFGGDYAESVDVLGVRAEYEPGDLIAIDTASPGKFTKTAAAYSKLVAGVYSTKPGLIGRRATYARPDKANEVPMAMMGILPVKVTAENGPIKPGDLLVSSGVLGYAMKGTDRDRMMGATIGKALAPLSSGTGLIEVLISLQ